MIKCTKCQGCVEWTRLEDNRSPLRIPAIHCINCGKYWYGKDESHKPQEYYVPKWQNNFENFKFTS